MAVKSVIMTVDKVPKVLKSMTTLIKKQVLIGIPDSGQNVRDDGPLNNATIGYLMEFGAPASNVPARPFLVPGVQNSEKESMAQVRKACDSALDGDMAAAEKSLEVAGIIASNEVKAMINSNIPPPLAPSTIRNRHRGRETKRRESEDVYLGLIAKGVEPGAAQAEVGIVSLINTGQLRNSITSVVRDKK